MVAEAMAASFFVAMSFITAWLIHSAMVEGPGIEEELWQQQSYVLESGTYPSSAVASGP